MSHELRAPLAIVTSSLDLLDLLDRSADDPQARRQRLLALRAEVNRMARIVSQVAADGSHG